MTDTKKIDPACSGSVDGACSLEASGHSCQTALCVVFWQSPADQMVNVCEHIPKPRNVKRGDVGKGCKRC